MIILLATAVNVKYVLCWTLVVLTSQNSSETATGRSGERGFYGRGWPAEGMASPLASARPKKIALSTPSQSTQKHLVSALEHGSQ
jgi:hypothetical protein